MSPSPRAPRLLRTAYAAALFGAVGWVLATRGEDVARLVGSARPELLAGCLLASAGQLALTSAVWTSALRRLGEPVPWRRVLLATAAGAPARYLPGGVWYAASRAAALRKDGVGARALAATAGLEMLLAPVTGVLLGSLLLLAAGGLAVGGLAVPLVVAAALLGLAATPPVVNRALRWRAAEPPPRVGWPVLGRVAGWLLLFWLWSGSVFALYVAAFAEAPDAAPPGVVGAYAVSWAVGWLAVFAPQGAGVFEATLAGILGGGPGLAVVLAGYRALVLVRDLAAGAAAWAVQRRPPPPQAEV